MEDGTPIDLNKNYTVAVSENQMMEVSDTITFFGVDSTELPFTLREAVTNSVKEQVEISPNIDGRIQISTLEE